MNNFPNGDVARKKSNFCCLVSSISPFTYLTYKKKFFSCLWDNKDHNWGKKPYPINKSLQIYLSLFVFYLSDATKDDKN